MVRRMLADRERQSVTIHDRHDFQDFQAFFRGIDNCAAPVQSQQGRHARRMPAQAITQGDG
jgi:hypothetical protein